MPKGSIVISDDLFDNKTDVTGRKYIYNSKNHLLYWVLFQMTSQAQNCAKLISEDRSNEIDNLIVEILSKADRNVKELDYVEDKENGKVGIGSYDFSMSIKDENIDWACEKLKYLQDTFEEVADEIKEPQVQNLYRGYAKICEMSGGNIGKAIEENQYLQNLLANSITGLKITANMPLEQSILGLQGKHPDQANLPEDQKADILNDFMTINTAFGGELEAEYLRQKNEKGNWEDDDAKQEYIERLRYEHRKNIDAFERLIKVNDVEQYDRYLDNSLNHMTERFEPGGRRGAARGVSGTIGCMKAELKALDNGWGPRDIGILGVIGMMEGNIDKSKSALNNRIKAENQKEPVNINAIEESNKKLEQINKLEESLKSLRDKCYGVKNPTAEQKLELATEIKNYVVANFEYSGILAVLNQFPRFENTIKNIKDDLAKGLNAKDQIAKENAEFQVVVDLHEVMLEAVDKYKDFAKDLKDISTYKDEQNRENEIAGLQAIKFGNNTKKAYEFYNSIKNNIKYLSGDLEKNNLLEISKHITHLSSDIETFLQVDISELDEDEKEGIAPVFDKLKEIKGYCDEKSKDLKSKIKDPVMLNVSVRRNIDILVKSGRKDPRLENDSIVKEDGKSFISGFEIVDEEEIRASKIASVEQKIFESKPENKAKIEENARKNLEERKAREKSKGKVKDRISINDLENEEHPDKKIEVTKAQGKKSVGSEIGKGMN